MSRLQKKCLMASLFTHGTLLLVMLIGSAFITPQPKIEAPTIELVDIPDILINENFAGGGNPEAAAPQPVARTPVPEQQPVTPPPQARPEPVKQPEPKPVVEKKPEPKPVDIKPTPKPTPKPVVKPADIKVNLKPVNRTVQVAKNNTKTAPAPDPTAKLNEAVNRLTENIERRASAGTAVAIPGPGGQAYAPYSAYLKKLYQDAWVAPSTASGNPVVEVEIVIARNGKVLSARITKRSGNSALDSSVQRALDRYSNVRPLPEGTKDDKRAFQINFNLLSN